MSARRPNYESSQHHNFSDSRDQGSSSEDYYKRQRDRYSPTFARRSSPHEHPRSRTPPRGPAAMNQRDYSSRDRRDLNYDDSSDPYAGSYHRKSSPRESYRSSRYDSRSRSRSRSPPRRGRARSPWYGGHPSREVIMEGLPVDATENDIKSELETHYQVQGLSDVRVIRDRQGISRHFGFLRFADMKTSTAFVEQNFPDIRLQGGSKDAVKVSIAFSREREDRDRQVADWICSNCTTSNFARRAECYKCQASKAYYSAGPLVKPPHLNTGDSDVSPDSTPSQFLLLRGLELSVTEELLAKGVSKLYKAAGDSSTGDQSAKKAGAKVTSTTASSNFGAQENSIRRVFIVRDRKTDDSWRFGFAEFHTVEDAQAALTKFDALDKFTIASKQVLVSYIHAGVFVPAYGQSADDLVFSFSAAANPSLRLAYWDPKGYLREHVVSEIPPSLPTTASHAGQTAAMGDAAAVEGVLKTVKEVEGKTKKRKAEASSSSANKKTVPTHLQFWKDRHAELHGNEGKLADQAPIQRDSKSKETPVENTQSYADPKKNCCYLCSRQFKSATEVNKHERISQLHRDNLNNDELKAKAMAKLAKSGVVQTATGSKSPPASDTLEYRDRAKERRTVFGQPKKPQATPSKAAQLAAEAEEEKPKGSSKGASLLGKMGWSAGQGLGAEGTGMVAPIATDVYAQGVGLGAAGGKLGDAAEEADRQTKGGYGAFLQKTKEGARGRWEQLKKD